jgi:hypothetical protein
MMHETRIPTHVIYVFNFLLAKSPTACTRKQGGRRKNKASIRGKKMYRKGQLSKVKCVKDSPLITHPASFTERQRGDTITYSRANLRCRCHVGLPSLPAGTYRAFVPRLLKNLLMLSGSTPCMHTLLSMEKARLTSPNTPLIM